MKIISGLGLLAATCVVAMGQGTVHFNNRVTAWGIDAPVTYGSPAGPLLSGPDWVAQLYAGPDADTLSAAGVPAAFRVGLGAGYVFGGQVFIASVPAGGVAAVMMKVWNLGDGSTFEEAAATADSMVGQSAVITVVTGNGGAPPAFPADLVGLNPFFVAPAGLQPLGVIPEPSSLALLALAACLLALLRPSQGLLSTSLQDGGARLPTSLK